MKTAKLVDSLDAEAARFTQLAKEYLFQAYHRSGGINDLDKRLVRDHEIRAETYKDAARMAVKTN